MFFVDGETMPSINGTGSEDYFLGAWAFGDQPFAHALYGAPVKGEPKAGARTSVHRFHFDSPIPFTKSLRAPLEHGHANHRSDNFYLLTGIGRNRMRSFRTCPLSKSASPGCMRSVGRETHGTEGRAAGIVGGSNKH
jgi:hypothetical protein